MQLKKSIGSGQPADVVTEEPISSYSTDVILHPQLNARLIQNVLLIWLDQHIDDNNLDCRNTIMQLRHVVNSINLFTDEENCIEFIQRMDTEKVCMITSGSFGEHIVTRIHNMSQVDSIFIFCSDKECHEQWTKEWSKIKGVFTEIVPICQALKQAAQQCEHNAVSISIMGTDDGPKKNLDQLDPSFMYLQIMKEILVDINYEEKHFKQYIDYCHEKFSENDRELRNIKKFERKYDDEIPIWWYTLNCFLYPMLNRALHHGSRYYY